MPGGDNLGCWRSALGNAAQSGTAASRAAAESAAAEGALAVRIGGKSFADATGRRHDVLGEISFTAGAGEILALLAPSGTGKTTILRIVLGLEKNFAGDVRLPEGRLGVMFQEPRLLPWLTVGDNLSLVAGADRGEILPLLAEVGLTGTEPLHPKALSLGMARRVALVRALIGHPSLLVLDEPFASLDPKSASGLAQLISNAARRDGALVLLSTHNLDPVLGCADRVLVLAGKPARLAADWPTGVGTPVAGGVAARLIKQRLLTRFPFLGAEAAEEEAP
ncbi:MAG: ABC transporter ATP-binding protein [Acetobacteraceae bacterium]